MIYHCFQTFSFFIKFYFLIVLFYWNLVIRLRIKSAFCENIPAKLKKKRTNSIMNSVWNNIYMIPYTLWSSLKQFSNVALIILLIVLFFYIFKKISKKIPIKNLLVNTARTMKHPIISLVSRPTTVLSWFWTVFEAENLYPIILNDTRQVSRINPYYIMLLKFVSLNVIPFCNDR